MKIEPQRKERSRRTFWLCIGSVFYAVFDIFLFHRRIDGHVHGCHGGDAVVLGDGHELDALRVAADEGNLVDGRADDDALGRNQHQLLTAADDADADDGTRFLRDLHIDEPFAAARLRAVLVRRGALAVAALGDGEHLGAAL